MKKFKEPVSGILIYSDMGNEYGLGHAVRMDALAEELRKRNHRVTHTHDWEMFEVNAPHMDFVIIDSYDKEDVLELTTSVLKIATEIEVLGPQYAILRRQFKELHGDIPVLKWQPIYDELFVLPVPKKRKTALRASTRTALVICSGGMTAMEFACMGIPMLVYESAPNQRQQIAWLVEAGAALELDHVSGEGWLEWDLPHKETLAAMSRAGRDLVDGRGAERVADIVEARLEGEGEDGS